MRRMRQRVLIEPGDVVHIHDHPNRLKLCWPGYVHAVFDNGEHGVEYRVSQLDKHSRATQFNIPQRMVHPVLWTFDGARCRKCGEKVP